MADISSTIKEYIEITNEVIALMDGEEPDVEAIIANMDKREAAIAELKAAYEAGAVTSPEDRAFLEIAAEQDSKLKPLFEAYSERLRLKVKQNNQGSRAVAGYRLAPSATYSTTVDRMQ